jgi:hypothetical protein
VTPAPRAAVSVGRPLTSSVTVAAAASLVAFVDL